MIKARTESRRIRRRWTIFGILLTTSVVLMGASGTGIARDLQSAAHFAFGPVETWLNDVTDSVTSYWSAITQIDHLRTENDQLTLENQTLRDELLRMPSIAKLNDDWTRITDAKLSSPYQSTIARVIVRDISTVRPQTIVLDRGSNDGIAAGQVVIDDGGALIGRIQTVLPTASTVLLLTDTGAVVVGREAQSGATGTVRGQGDRLQISNVDVSAKLQKGQAIVTAGETLACTNDRSPYPPGLLIGEITDVQSDPNAIFQSASIAPASHPATVIFALVLTNYAGGFASGSPAPTPTPASGSPAPAPSATVAPAPSPTAQC